MDFAQQLLMLEAAGGDPGRLAELSVDLRFATLPAEHRDRIRAALLAAAVPHWCDADVLAALLEVPRPDAAQRLQELRRLAIVEPFPARGSDALNVHEASRLALRRRLAAEEPQRLAAHAGRAAAWFGRSEDAPARVETIYHLLTADPPAGAALCARWCDEWDGANNDEERDALALAMRELVDAALVAGLARAEAQLAIGAARRARGEESTLEPLATDALALATAAGSAWTEVRALAMLADARRAQGDLGQAEQLCLRAIDAAQRIAAADDVRRRRCIADGQHRLGNVLRDQRRLAPALAAFEEAARIVGELLEDQPEAPSLLHDLFACAAGIGDVLYEQQQYPQAHESYELQLKLSVHLADLDKDDRSRQRDVAVAWSRMGSSYNARAKYAEALDAFQRGNDIARALHRSDPSHIDWKDELAASGVNCGMVLHALDRDAEALDMFKASVATFRELVAADPGNPKRRDALANALSWAATLLAEAPRAGEAEPLAQEAVRIGRELRAIDATNAVWGDTLRSARRLLVDVLAALGRKAESEAVAAEAEREDQAQPATPPPAT